MLKTVGYKEVEKMFDNAGKQIKGIAIGFFITQIVVGILAAVILFVISALADEDVVWIGCLLGGLFTLVATPFAAWFSALILYGFGEIVDTAIANRLNSDGEASAAPVVSQAVKKVASPIIPKQPEVPKTPKTEKERFFSDNDDDWMDICCPHCGEKLSFLKGTAMGQCPNCDNTFDIK